MIESNNKHKKFSQYMKKNTKKLRTFFFKGNTICHSILD